jgi:hypothetical protein
MKRCHSFRQFSLSFPALLILAVHANACPDCTLINSGGIIEPQTVMAKTAFSCSTLLFMGIVFSVMGFLVWMMVKTCRDLDQERLLSSVREV